MANSENVESNVIFVQCSIETFWKRWGKNIHGKSRPSINKDLVQVTIDQFEVPTEDEKVIVIVNT